MTLNELIPLYQQRVEHRLADWLPAANIQPARLHEAMRYAVLGGGKRVRPLLVYLTGRALGAADEVLDAPACAVELIHAYSLVHDDLPAMDNDLLRRGRPTCHAAFDEATAILTGDALQTLAFQILAQDRKTAGALSAERRLEMSDALALASGSRGMAGGQALDIAAVGKDLNLAELENMHIHKTGALIRASVKLGALCSQQLQTAQLERLDHYAKCIGLAFQIQDDILDVEGDTATLGKPQGSDRDKDKPTYPALLGLNEAKHRAGELVDQALAALAHFGPSAEPLRWMASYIITRHK